MCSVKIFYKNNYLRIIVLWLFAAGACAATPETVRFASRDGKTELVGYLFKPGKAGPHPAVVMLHGRGGPYSTLRSGLVSAENLTARHHMWGEFWAARGYLALHVDSFSPRGHPRGFPIHSYSKRPPEVNEQTVRPLDAYGALDYLRTRGDVFKDRIGVQGWSNGAMTLLAAMGGQEQGFRAALAQYPGCRVQHDQAYYKPYAPLLMLVASDDNEVSPRVCAALAAQLKQRGAEIEFVIYDGAHHSYDEPGKTKQSHAPNRAALQDTLPRAEAFFAKHLRP